MLLHLVLITNLALHQMRNFSCICSFQHFSAPFSIVLHPLFDLSSLSLLPPPYSPPIFLPSFLLWSLSLCHYSAFPLTIHTLFPLSFSPFLPVIPSFLHHPSCFPFTLSMPSLLLPLSLHLPSHSSQHPSFCCHSLESVCSRRQ